MEVNLGEYKVFILLLLLFCLAASYLISFPAVFPFPDVWAEKEEEVELELEEEAKRLVLENLPQATRARETTYHVTLVIY